MGFLHPWKPVFPSSRPTNPPLHGINRATIHIHGNNIRRQFYLLIVYFSLTIEMRISALSKYNGIVCLIKSPERPKAVSSCRKQPAYPSVKNRVARYRAYLSYEKMQSPAPANHSAKSPLAVFLVVQHRADDVAKQPHRKEEVRRIVVWMIWMYLLSMASLTNSLRLNGQKYVIYTDNLPF